MKKKLLLLPFLLFASITTLDAKSKTKKPSSSSSYKYKDNGKPYKVRLYQYRSQLERKKYDEMKKCYDLIYSDRDVRYCVLLEKAILDKINVEAAKMTRKR